MSPKSCCYKEKYILYFYTEAFKEAMRSFPSTPARPNNLYEPKSPIQGDEPPSLGVETDFHTPRPQPGSNKGSSVSIQWRQDKATTERIQFLPCSFEEQEMYHVFN